MARQLQVVPKHPKKQQLMDVLRPHKTNCLDRKQLFGGKGGHAFPSKFKTINNIEENS